MTQTLSGPELTTEPATIESAAASFPTGSTVAELQRAVELLGEPEAGTEAAGGEGEGQQLNERATLDEVLKLYPHLEAEIEEKRVTPKVTEAETRGRRMGATEAEPLLRERIRVQSLTEERDRLLDKALDGNKEAGARVKAIHAELQNIERARDSQASLQRAVVDEVLKNVLGLDIAKVPDEARKDWASLRRWGLQQSPEVQAAIAAAAKTTNEERETVENAQRAASFGARNQATPRPNVGNQASPPAGKKNRTFAEIEKDYVDGKVSFEEYSKARANNPRLRSRV